MENLSAYVPIDRRWALVHGTGLPDRTQGTALFADISGFTPLTNALVKVLGPLRGAEEITHRVDRVFDALIANVERYGGSVIGFSGDAITCWFDGDDGLRALASALAMQQAMDAFKAVQITSEITVSLAMKAAVASGPVRRFLVGDPQIQVIEVVAGTTLDRLAAAEHHAGRGEVVLDPATAAALSDRVDFLEWRQDAEEGGKYGIVAALKVPVAPKPWPPLPSGALPPEVVQPWLLPAIYERLLAGKGDFLAEFRPAAALFLLFGGIDYDHDDVAGQKLDGYIRQVQEIMMKYDGSLLQITLGDKGSYLAIAFGAPVAHEDYVVRAVSAALDLRKLAPASGWAAKIQIGIAVGRLRTGAYGGVLSHIYGVLGNEVNLAARLMQSAGPGQILVSQAVPEAAGQGFVWEALPPLKVKGRTELMTVFSLGGVKARPSLRLQEPKYSLPMVGRETELALAREKLAQARQGHGQILGIMGEAGMGKSRLVAEVIQLAYQEGLTAYGGECQSYGTNTSYLVWQHIWRGFFNLNPALPIEEILKELQVYLTRLDPDLLPRLPLLGAVLNLPIPDNDLTRSLDAKLRRTSLEALLVDCLRAHSREEPLLLVLENLHWIDPLSSDLLRLIGRSIANLPVLLIVVYRPFDERQWKDTGLNHLAYFTELSLVELTSREAERLISLKLAQLFGSAGALTPDLVENITRRAEGNPFYIEELLNYLRDLQIDPRDIRALAQIDLPSSLHSLILTRIDQRTESQKITLKLASVIGRIFIAAWLWGAYPELGDPQQVRADLDRLSRVDLTPLETDDPELTYLFKHIVTQEVAYGSLPFATRAILHDQLAQFIESALRDNLDQYVDLLAFHYEHSDNLPKKREYFRKAGESAQLNYANEAAIRYYRNLLPLLAGTEQVPVMLKLGQVLELTGEWDAARQLYQQALQIAEAALDQPAQASCRAAIGDLLRKHSLYEEAYTWLELAREAFEEVGDLAGMGQVLHSEGTLAAQQGELETARSFYERSLAIRRQLDDKPQIASLMNNLGILARLQGDHDRARQLQAEGLEIRREIGDRFGIAASLNNLGNIALDLGSYAEAKSYLEEAVIIQREIGSKFYIANALNNLGNVVRAQGDYGAAKGLYRESLAIDRELGDGWAIAYLLEDIGSLEALADMPERALQYMGAASSLREKIGAPLSPTERAKLDATINAIRQNLSQEQQAEAWDKGLGMSLEQAVEFALLELS
jgi:adenylate cyclase